MTMDPSQGGLTEAQKLDKNIYDNLLELQTTEESFRQGIANELNILLVDTLEKKHRTLLTSCIKAFVDSMTIDQYIDENSDTLVKKIRESSSEKLKKLLNAAETRFNSEDFKSGPGAEWSDIFKEYLKRQDDGKKLVKEVKENYVYIMEEEFEAYKEQLYKTILYNHIYPTNFKNYLRSNSDTPPVKKLLTKIKQDLPKESLSRLEKYLNFISTDIFVELEIKGKDFASKQSKNRMIQNICNEIERALENPDFETSLLNMYDDQIFLEKSLGLKVSRLLSQPIQRRPRYLMFLNNILTFANKLKKLDDTSIMPENINQLKATIQNIETSIKNNEIKIYKKEYIKITKLGIDPEIVKILEGNRVFLGPGSQKEVKKVFIELQDAIEKDADPEEIIEIFAKHKFTNPDVKEVNFNRKKIRLVTADQIQAIKEAYIINLEQKVYPFLESQGIDIIEFASPAKKIAALKEIRKAIESGSPQHILEALKKHGVQNIDLEKAGAIEKNFYYSKIEEYEDALVKFFGSDQDMVELFMKHKIHITPEQLRVLGEKTKTSSSELVTIIRELKDTKVIINELTKYGFFGANATKIAKIKNHIYFTKLDTHIREIIRKIQPKIHVYKPSIPLSFLKAASYFSTTDYVIQDLNKKFIDAFETGDVASLGEDLKLLGLDPGQVKQAIREIEEIINQSLEKKPGQDLTDEEDEEFVVIQKVEKE